MYKPALFSGESTAAVMYISHVNIIIIKLKSYQYISDIYIYIYIFIMIREDCKKTAETGRLK